MSNLVSFAQRELEIAGVGLATADYGGQLGASVLELIEVFAKQGHSGGSAGMTIALFNKLAKFEPLSGLTGEDSEWMEYALGQYQNNRCSHVFKDSKDGEAYDAQGFIFQRKDGSRYTVQPRSRRPVTFPYNPVSETIMVEDGE